MCTSMTGFAQKEGRLESMIYRIELRSVNSRYCEVSTRLPEGLRLLDTYIRESARAKLIRGKIDCWITLSQLDDIKEKSLNPKALEEWVEYLKTLGKTYALNPPDWQTLLLLPGVMQQEETAKETVETQLKLALDEAFSELSAMRKREGEKIAQVLFTRLEELEAVIAKVEAELPKGQQELQDKMRERLALLDVEVEPARFEQELALNLMKMDVQEEIDRLHFHIKEVKKVLQEPTSIGRRLDFLMQELNREANTFGVKTASHTLNHHAVEMKVIIEQMREQIQNLV